MAIVERSSLLYKTAVEHYVRHRPGDNRTCPRCGHVDCATQRHAADVIAAAGADPALYDRPARRPIATYWSNLVTAELPVYRRS